MRCICTNSAGLEAEHGHKVKLKVLTPLNFLTSPSFSVTLPSYDPQVWTTLNFWTTPSFLRTTPSCKPAGVRKLTMDMG